MSIVRGWEDGPALSSADVTRARGDSVSKTHRPVYRRPDRRRNFPGMIVGGFRLICQRPDWRRVTQSGRLVESGSYWRVECLTCHRRYDCAMGPAISRFRRGELKLKSCRRCHPYFKKKPRAACRSCGKTDAKSRLVNMCGACDRAFHRHGACAKGHALRRIKPCPCGVAARDRDTIARRRSSA